MVLDLQSNVGDFEGEVLKGIRSSSNSMLINETLYFCSVDVNPGTRREVLDYLKKNQRGYGKLHPMELESHVDLSSDTTISLNPTEEQVMALARDVDAAYATNTDDALLGPLRDIKRIYVGGLIKVIDDFGLH